LAVLLGTVFYLYSPAYSQSETPDPPLTEQPGTEPETRSTDRVGTKDFDGAFYALKRETRLQFEIADPPAPKSKTETPERKKKGKPFSETALGKFLSALFSGGATVFAYIFWGGVALLIAFILYHFGKEIIAARQRREPKEDKQSTEPAIPLYVPDAEQARILLDDVDKLAAQGRFEDAVHTLLFRSIQDIDIKRPNAIRRSLTAREIGSLEILTPLTRDAFAKIARVVETSFFGGQKIGQDEFARCREAYANFASKQAWSRTT